jgi:branched-chain amino acid transport system substrate-binding protein
MRGKFGITRRVFVAGATAPMLAPLARAQAPKPFVIGLTADMSGPFVDFSGPGQTVAVEMAVQDFGGSVLGRPLKILSADDQNKADVASAMVRRWFDVEGAEAIVGGGNSSCALAILNVARSAGKSFMISAAGNPALSGTECSPISTHWAYDTYAQATATGTYLTEKPGESWFFVTSDYAFGHALERDAAAVVQKLGGKVLGSVRAPLGTPDFSSFLLQAQASKARTVGLAVAGHDLINIIKQAGEFGVGAPGSGQRLAGLTLFASDLPGLGPQAAQGLVSTESFYWDRNEETRAWTRRFHEKRPGKIPNLSHAGVYSAVLHYLKAVQAVGGADAVKVNEQMRRTPVDDFNNNNVAIRPDGRVMHPMYVLRAKAPSASKGPFDVQEILATVPPEQAFRAAGQTGCKLPA